MKCPYCIKACTKCNKILIAYEGNFHKKKGGRYGLHTECKSCRKQYHKQWRKNNFDHCKEYDAQWRENNREHYREYKKQYYKDNEEYYKELSAQWRKNNPDKRFNYNNSRRLKEESQGRGITSEQWYKMMEFFEWKCAYSGEYLGGDNKDKKRTVDHIIPLDNGGLNEPWNCVPMYRPYNTSKHTRNMEEWYKQQDFFSEERLQKIYEWQEYAYNKWNGEIK